MPSSAGKKSKTLCLDGHSGIDSAEAGSLPTNPRADPARLHSAAQKKTQETPVQLILGHYTRFHCFLRQRQFSSANVWKIAENRTLKSGSSPPEQRRKSGVQQFATV